MKSPRIFLAINYVNYANEDKKRWQKTAISVLEKIKPPNVCLASFNYPDDVVNLPPSFRVFKMLKRDSMKDLGNNRRMPYVKEIFDLCSKTNSNIFGYINSDILLKPNFFDILNEKQDAYVFYKRDIGEVSVDDFISGKINVVDEKPAGVDGFFFNRIWWFNNNAIFPNGLIVGETEWDTAYNSIIQKAIGNRLIKRELFHVYHDRIWNIDSRGGIANRLIWQAVRDRYGLPTFVP